jgi:hypothetical protein
LYTPVTFHHLYERVSSSAGTERSALTTEILLVTSSLLCVPFSNLPYILSFGLPNKLGRPTVDLPTSDKIVNNAQHKYESEDSAGPVYHNGLCQLQIGKSIVLLQD